MNNRFKFVRYQTSESLISSQHTSVKALYLVTILAMGAAAIMWGVAYNEPEVEIPTAHAATVVVAVPPVPVPVVVADNDEATAEGMLQGSPMAGLGSNIVKTSKAQSVDWHLVIGLASAESSLGRNFYKEYDATHCFNFWGIKPPGGQRPDGSYLRCYFSAQDGINSIVSLLARRYPGQTVEKMCGTYKVPCTQSWINNVNKFIK